MLLSVTLTFSVTYTKLYKASKRKIPKISGRPGNSYTTTTTAVCCRILPPVKYCYIFFLDMWILLLLAAPCLAVLPADPPPKECFAEAATKYITCRNVSAWKTSCLPLHRERTGVLY